jgi:Holliday junction resolvase-like predicted endonuclease
MYVLKAGGKKEFFNKRKIINSLVKIGLDKKWAKQVADEARDRFHKKSVQSDEIFNYVLDRLGPYGPEYLGKYNLRRAIMDLGPTGYPFEKYVARILEEYGYQTKINQIIKGSCVNHEIDVLAEKDKTRFIVECKYHNTPGARSDLKVVLYLWARFIDIKRKWEAESKQENEKYHGIWLITNTRCTSEAIAYGECMDVVITGWGYPDGMSLEDLVEKKQLYPINLFPRWGDKWLCSRFHENKIFLLKDILSYSAGDLAKKMRLKRFEIEQFQQNARKLCENHSN